jgi:protein-tyrosine phosphatase
VFRRVSLPDDAPGRLYLHSMPGRYETIETFLSEARKEGLSAVVCLAAESELSASLGYSEARSGKALPFRTRDFPILDFGVPSIEDRPSFIELIAEIAGDLRRGEAVLVHCRMGIGRTGTVAACVLLELGLGVEEARHEVASAGSRSEVPEQRDFVDWYGSFTRSR